MTWYDGGLMPPPHEALGGFRLQSRGCMFVGEKGVIQCDGGGGAPGSSPIRSVPLTRNPSRG